MKLHDLAFEDIRKYSVFKYIDENSDEIVPDPEIYNQIKENSGYYLITGEAMLADGTRYSGIFGISSDDGGEMFEFYFFTDELGWLSNNDDLSELLKKSKNYIFPFKYHL